jgi:hypothetical protein
MRRSRFAAPAAVLPVVLSFLLLAGCDDLGREPVAPASRGDAGFAASEPRGELPTDGPTVTLGERTLGLWKRDSSGETREVFAGSGLLFRWRAHPGRSGAPIVGYSFAVNDSSDWSPVSAEFVWPPQDPSEPEVLWFPSGGLNAFYLRAFDADGESALVVARISVLGGPGQCPGTDSYVLVVLDTNPDALIERGDFPPDYAEQERERVDAWFAGTTYSVFETHGRHVPPASLLDCATSTFWIHSADVAGGDDSALRRYHTRVANLLQSYSAAGGNVFLCGVQPTEAMRHFRNQAGVAGTAESYPVRYIETLTEPDLAPHWAVTSFGLDRVEETVGEDAASGDRLTVATSCVTAGGNPYPDLAAASGPFTYYDRGLIPWTSGGAEVIYKADDTGDAIGVRLLLYPGAARNTVLLALHPQFVDPVEFGELIDAVLTDFGEERSR